MERNMIKAAVHLVATDKMEHNGLQILKHSSFLRLPITGAEGRRLVAKGLIPQHLYFTTDEEIKEGAKYLDIRNNHIGTAFKNNAGFYKDCVKIVATTNPELWDIKDKFQGDAKTISHLIPNSGIPKIDTPFIEAYIKAYNEGNPIKEVLLEQIDNGEGDWTGDNYTGEPFWNSKWELKLKPNGSVIVHPIKEMTYSKEQVRRMLMGFNPTTKSSIARIKEVEDYIDAYYPE